VIVIFLLPESPKWLASRRGRLQRGSAPDSGRGADGTSVGAADALEKQAGKQARRPRETILRDLFRPPLLRLTLVGIVLASIPLVGAWAASKWMIPWADKVASATHPGYKATVQGWWALGATLGSFCGAQVAGWLGRRLSYFLISLGTTVLTISMFQLRAPLEPGFLPLVFAQGFVATLFFGWLPLYLPELFPTRVRAAGTGVAMNTGRFATAIGVLVTGAVFALLGGSYPSVGTVGTVVYALGMIAIWFAPDTSGSNLDD
jgi:MFS family permease